MKILNLFLALLFITEANAIESLNYFAGYPAISTNELSGLVIKDYVDLNEEKCKPSYITKSYVDSMVTTEKTKEVLVMDNSKVNAELKEVTLKNGVINFKLEGTQSYTKYNVPVLLKVTRIASEARPISTTLAGLFTLGLYPILSPKDFAQSVVGCSDITAVNFVYDADNKKTTNTIEKIPVETYESRFLIKGFEKESEFDSSDIFFSIYSKDDPFDLKDIIIKKEVKNVREIIISCLSCTNSEAEFKLAANFEELKQSTIKNIKDEEIATKKKEIEIENKRKEAAAKYQKAKEEVAQKALKDKEAKEQLTRDLREKEQSAKILKAKEKCIALGYPSGSDKLNKCVLQLLE